MRLTYADLTETAPHEFSACASDLGLPPGYFPTAILTDIGNKQVLVVEHASDCTVTYRQELGCITVKIFND